jgi:RNA polymerase sigma factor (sigma-70 family)
MKEYRVELRVKNNLLLTAIENAGFKSIAEFSRSIGVHMPSVHRLVTLKEAPLKQNGTFTTTAQKILDHLCALPEDLWSEEQLWNTLTTNKGQVLLDKYQMSVLTYGEDEEVLTLEDMVHKKEIQNKVHEVLHTLSPRERKVVEMRFGLNGMEQHTYEETGTAFDVSHTRVRQIEYQALSKLRHPARAEILKNFLAKDVHKESRIASWNTFVKTQKPDREDLETCHFAFACAYNKAIKSTYKKPLNRNTFWDAHCFIYGIDPKPIFASAYNEGWKQGLEHAT